MSEEKGSVKWNVSVYVDVCLSFHLEHLESGCAHID